MKLIDDIKTGIGQLLLNREATTKKQPHKPLSFEKSEQVGIVYDAAYIDRENEVHQYANKLRSEGKKVFLLGFVNMKQLPGNKKFSMQSEYFWKEKLNAFNLPVKNKVGRFLEMEFDWLLNLYTEPVLPMLAISAYSKAKCRVGPNIPGGVRYFDTLIDTGGRKELSFFIQQMDFYLRIVQ